MSRRRSRRELLTAWLELFRDAGSALSGRRHRPLDELPFPPGADPVRYLELCTGCGDCVEACGPGAIVMVERPEGPPVAAVDPSREPCVLCDGLPCIAACGEGALRDPGGPEAVRMGIAVVDPRRCVAFTGERCTLCHRACPFPDRAILLVGMRPVVASGACTGCGLCEAVCPVDPPAIQVVPERNLVPGLRIPKEHAPAG